MSEGIPYADIVILALIAGFILLRLRSILGDKTGNDAPSYFNRPQVDALEKPEPVVQIEDKSLKMKNREEGDVYLATLANRDVADALGSVKAKDPSFSATQFLLGARGAFEMVFDAFSKGDKDTLRMLLSDAIYRDFVQEIEAREAQENKSDSTLISCEAKDITSASLVGNTARLTVQFISEQVHVVRDKNGAIIDGDASEIHHVEDEWTFERDITSRNPNWKVIET